MATNQDRQLRAIADRVRREIIEFIDHYKHARVQTLVHEVAEELDEDPESLEVELVHAHLPMLDEYGIVDYDEINKEVEATERTVKMANMVAQADQITE